MAQCRLGAGGWNGDGSLERSAVRKVSDGEDECRVGVQRKEGDGVGWDGRGWKGWGGNWKAGKGRGGQGGSGG